MASNETPDTSNKAAEFGTIEEIDGRHVLRFERLLQHPVDEVWEALTRPERMQDWFGEGEIDLDLVEGGVFEVRITGPAELVDAIITVAGEEGLIQHNMVLRVEPPVVFEHTFGAPDSLVRWELQPEGDGCRLRLTHTEPPGFSISEGGPRDLAGWHALLERLDHALGGGRSDWRQERWQELRDEYAARLPG
jgi:uncharacterized protein YndB with AHSA1/START domain